LTRKFAEYILKDLEVDNKGQVSFNQSLKKSDYDWIGDSLSNKSDNYSKDTVEHQKPHPQIDHGKTLEIPNDIDEPSKPGKKDKDNSFDSADDIEEPGPPILVVDHAGDSKENSTGGHNMGRRKSHFEIMADKIIQISSFDELIKTMRDNKISWMDFFYQIDSTHADKVSSYEVYVHLFRDMKISKKLATKIVKEIDFNMDGFATLEEWMKYEMRLPADIQVNAVYKWADFKARLFQMLKDNNLKWSSVFEQSKKFSEAGFIPTRFILETLVGTYHMPRHNVKELLQKMDVDQDGIISDKEWISFFKESDITDPSVKPLLFDVQEKLAVTALKAANKQLVEEASVTPLLANLGIIDEINYLDQSPVAAINPESTLGVNMPPGDFTLYIESDVSTLDTVMLPLFNDPATAEKLEKIRQSTIERFNTSSPDGSPKGLNTSPSAKPGLIGVGVVEEKVSNSGAAGLDRLVRPVNAESQIMNSPSRGTGLTGFDSMLGNTKKPVISPIKEEPNQVQKGGNDGDQFSEGFSLNGGNANFEGGSFDLEGSEGKSAGLERSFSCSSDNNDSLAYSAPSCPSKLISICTRPSSWVPEIYSQAIFDNLFALKLPTEEISVTKLVGLLQRQLVEVPKKVLADIAKSVDQQRSGFVQKSDWTSFIDELMAARFSVREEDLVPCHDGFERQTNCPELEGRSLPCGATAQDIDCQTWSHIVENFINELRIDQSMATKDNPKSKLIDAIERWLDQLPLSLPQVSTTPTLIHQSSSKPSADYKKEIFQMKPQAHMSAKHSQKTQRLPLFMSHLSHDSKDMPDCDQLLTKASIAEEDLLLLRSVLVEFSTIFDARSECQAKAFAVRKMMEVVTRTRGTSINGNM
jgi:hypothetical protein